MKEEIRTQLKAKIATLDRVSAAPVILQPLLDLLRQPSDEVPTDEVVGLVSRDGAIAAQCLRMANSPLFARHAVETVRGAVMTVGIDRVRSLLFGLCMNQTVPKDKWVLDANAFWRHSLGCALVTQTLAQGISYPEPEKAYLAGLLHDLGFLVNSVLYTDSFRRVLASAVAQRCALHVAEEQVLGFTHADSGAMVCELWGFSHELTEAVRDHHVIDGMPASSPLVCLVHLGDLLSRVRNLGYGYDEIMAIVFARNTAWGRLLGFYPALAEMDMVRFTLEIDARLDSIAELVDTVFAPPTAAAAPTPCGGE